MSDKPKPTHIIHSWPSQDAERLYRADDGMCVGERKDFTVIWGPSLSTWSPTNPEGRKSRIFMEHHGDTLVDGRMVKWCRFGARFLREVAAKDDLALRGIEGDPVIEVEYQEGLISLAPDSLDLMANGGGSAKLRKM